MAKWMVTTKTVSSYSQLIEADSGEAAKTIAREHSHSQKIDNKSDAVATAQLASVGQAERYADRLITPKT